MRRFAFALLVLGLGAGVAAADEPKIGVSSWYPAQEGFEWHYKTAKGSLMNKVTKHEKVGDVMCARVETFVGDRVVSNEHIAIEKDKITRQAMLGFRPEPPVTLLQLPPKKGDEWTIDSKIGTETMKGKGVIDEEEVEVPAGKFKTTKVTIDIETNGMKIKSVCWYAEKTGMVKQFVDLAGNQVTLELEKAVVPK